MSIKLSRKDQGYIKRQVRHGNYANPEAVIAAGLRRLREEDEMEFALLKQEIRAAAESLDRGEGVVWNVEAAKKRLIRRAAKLGIKR